MAKRVAVIVCHGMGQQVAFQTLADVASSVGRMLAVDADAIRTRLVSNGDRYLARAELTLDQAPQGPTDVHFFEGYWAPLVEGKVSLLDTLRFLLDAGGNGVRFALMSGEFDRWMFGQRRRFEIPARRVYQFMLALWVVVLLAAGYASLAAAIVTATIHLFGLATRATPSTASLLALGWTMVAAAMISAVIGAVITVAWLLYLISRGLNTHPSSTNSETDAIAAPLWRRLGALVLAVTIMGSSLLIPVLIPAIPIPVSVSLAVLTVLLGIISTFLIGHVGDVAAYISPYKVSRFLEIRNAIQAVGRSVTEHVYAARTAGHRALYDEVIFVGHSLGSVLAYDSLDDALARDERPNGWGRGSARRHHDVARRTRLLLTFGSPLDKTAFVFRLQGDRKPSLREKIAALVQPLIRDHRFRARLRWVNLWSPADWIGGSLELYDETVKGRRAPDPSGTDVRNVRVSSSFLPDRAHTDYWKHDLMPAVIAHAILGEKPLGIGSDVRDALDKAFG